MGKLLLGGLTVHPSQLLDGKHCTQGGMVSWDGTEHSGENPGELQAFLILTQN